MQKKNGKWYNSGRSQRTQTCENVHVVHTRKKNYGNKLPQANDINLAGLMNKYSN